MWETVAFNVPPEISKNQLLGPRRAQKEPKGPPKEFIEPTRRPPKTPLGRFLPPQNAERKKKEATLGGPWGQMYVFLEEKRLSPKWPFGPPGSSRRGLRAPRWPQGPLLKIIGAPWDLLFRPLVGPGPPREPNQKSEIDLWGPLGGANLTFTWVRMHSAKKRKK